MQEVTIRGQKLILHTHKAVYWEDQKTLLVADFHIGKSAHFRRNAIPVHSGIDKVNIKNLYSVLMFFKAEHLIFLGDLFHSKVYDEWKLLKNLLDNMGIKATLIMGNHDIMAHDFYDKMSIQVVANEMVIHPFFFSHKPQCSGDSTLYNIAGHIHPGIVLRGKGKQSERLPCFYFNDNQGLIPAFGEFTGLTILNPHKNDLVFAVTEHTIFAV
jgi:uncharacterized protein